jgi:hypothetical protein
MHDTKEARKRSVDSLQRLYTVVVSLAVTEALRRLLSSGTGDYTRWLIFASFVVTVVPFYHGANRHLDVSYVTEERKAKPGALMIDFVFLFIEGILFFALAVRIDSRDIFYTLLAVLFLLDVFWIGFTYISRTNEEDRASGYVKWAIMNLVAGAAIGVSIWSNIFGSFWANETAKDVALVSITISRTVLDYILQWHFYYPPEEKSPSVLA